MSVVKTISVVAYTDKEENPTCCAKWHLEKCMFLAEKKFGSIPVCLCSGNEIHYGESGFLVQDSECPVWSDKP